MADPSRHGLQARRTKFWLGEEGLLPTHMKHARILTFGHNADVTLLFGKTSSDRILQHAHTLVAELVADREVSLWFHVSAARLRYFESLKKRQKARLYLYAIH